MVVNDVVSGIRVSLQFDPFDKKILPSAVFVLPYTVYCYFCHRFSFLLFKKTLLSHTMFRKTPIYLVLALLIGSVTLSAQTPPKYGHMNLGNLLESMPETKAANDKLKVYADSLSAIDEKMTKTFQEAYKKLEEEYNAGLLTPVQAQTRQAEMQKQQEEIQKFEQQAQQAITSRREDLLKPILTKVETAVKAVATENSYLMIFDTSSGAFLFAAEADDVSALVRKKLGM